MEHTLIKSTLVPVLMASCPGSCETTAVGTCVFKESCIIMYSCSVCSCTEPSYCCYANVLVTLPPPSLLHHQLDVRMLYYVHRHVLKSLFCTCEQIARFGMETGNLGLGTGLKCKGRHISLIISQFISPPLTRLHQSDHGCSIGRATSYEY